MTDKREHLGHTLPTSEPLLAEYEPAEIVIPLAGLLFLRWADQLDAEQEAIAEFDGSDYTPTLPERLRWRSWYSLRGEELSLFLEHEFLPGAEQIAAGPQGYRLQRVLSAIRQFLIGDERSLSHTGRLDVVGRRDALISWVSEQPFETASDRQRVGEAFDSIVARAFPRSGRARAEITNADAITELMVELADPKPEERIYDPCFGIGSLLVRCAHRLRRQARQMPSRVWTDVQQRSIFGVEINVIPYLIGMTRVILAGIENPGLERADALTRPLIRNRSTEGFDCILAFPPWGVVWHPRIGEEFPQFYPVRTKNTETLFLQHVMSSLRPGGRAIIALPEGTLFRTGAERKVRELLLSEYRVDGVISIPAGSLGATHTVKGNILIFRRELPGKAVRFYSVDRLALGIDQKADRDALPAKEVAQRFREEKMGDELWEIPVDDLARRDYELVAKRPGDEGIGRLLNGLQQIDRDVPIKEVREAAEIFSGMSYEKNNTSLEPDDPELVIGLLRVADINKGKVTRPTLFLTSAAANKVGKRARLLPGDVLLSVSGSIGKVGIVANGGVGAVASKSITVLRPREGLSPHYLSALLQSESVQRWLSGHARGVTIQHLSIRTLNHLKIPVPPIPIQDQVAQKWASRGGDAISILLSQLGEAEDDPIANWLEASPVVQEIRYRPDREKAGDLVLLDRFARELQNLRNRLDHAAFVPERANRSIESFAAPMPDVDFCLAASQPVESGRSDVSSWLDALNAAVKQIQGISDVPEGMGRLVMLKDARLGIEYAYRLIQDIPSPLATISRDVTTKIRQFLDTETEAILSNIRLHPTLDPAWIVVGKECEVSLRLHNQSPLALRNVSVRTEPEIGYIKVPYLPEGGSVDVPLRVPIQSTPSIFVFYANWRLDRLDGESVSGEIPLSVEIRSTRQAVHAGELGTNPFITGSPVDRPEMFIGRDSIVNRIRRQLSTRHRANVILLEGNRRTGKTSILKHIESESILPGWIPVYCSFQGGEGDKSRAGLPTREVFRLMAREIGSASYRAGFRTWFPNQAPSDEKRRFEFQFNDALAKAFSNSNEQPFETFGLYLQSVLKAIRPRRLLLMLDEFDKLQDGIDSRITSPQVPENIRHLLHTYIDLSAILTGSRRLKRLREEYWSALFGFGYRVGVGPLSREDARKLVTQPVQGQISFVPQATDYVVELCARQPFIIQCLCSRIFDYAAESNERTITLSAVEEAAREMVSDNEHFRTLWNYAKTERRRLLLALCQRLSERPEPITLDLLEAQLESLGVIVPKGERVGADLEYLRELELLQMDNVARVSTYRVAVPLMGRWIIQHIDFDDLVELAKREGEERA